MSTTYTGPNLYLAFKGVAIQSDYRSFTPTDEIKFEDGSAGSDAAILKYTTLKDGKASLTMRAPAGTAGTALWITTLALGAEGTLEWGPQGTATSNRREYVNAIVVGREETLEYSKITEWKISWEFSTATGITHTTY
jgi:hypothetical protein